MPHRTRPMASLLLFIGLNLVLVNTVSPVYDSVCFLPYWERRLFLLFSACLFLILHSAQRERRRKEHEAALSKHSETT